MNDQTQRPFRFPGPMATAVDLEPYWQAAHASTSAIPLGLPVSADAPLKISRVNQLDAAFLDAELDNVLLQPFLDALPVNKPYSKNHTLSDSLMLNHVHPPRICRPQLKSTSPRSQPSCGTPCSGSVFQETPPAMVPCCRTSFFETNDPLLERVSLNSLDVTEAR